MSRWDPFVVAGVQARTGSSRLPGKVLEDLEGRTLIERVVERVRRAARVDAVYVLTSTEPGDDELAAWCEAQGIDVRRGSEDDVLSRYLALAEELEPDHVVRVTGDCPLLEPTFVDRQLAALAQHDADFTQVDQAGLEGTLCGMGAMSRRALEAAAESTDPRDREHVGSFFFQAAGARFRRVPLEVPDVYRRPHLRLTVDVPADLALARAVYAEFAPAGAPAAFSTADVIRWLDAQPDVAALNAGVEESAANRELRRLRRAS